MILWQPSNSAPVPSNIWNVNFTLYHLFRKKIFFCWFTYAVSPTSGTQELYAFLSVKRGVLCTHYSPSSKSVKRNVSQHKEVAVHSKNFLQSVACPWVSVVRLCTAHIQKYWRSNNPLPSTSFSSSYILHLVQIFHVFTKQEWQLR
jgi:hypothetical protein